ncbi:ENHANCED DOWNY MILDEW 2 [Olea europaea subsp. europaea]|uniref:ENHANCED DOWNY MILDEW 2 n=1 Tax=Olea europaea subsp. europaea TaxID=158383 RepID=A0A8S0T212_OLEEU|nr:ENHANCED DOWNY MILDEW 2 [Olea europaea subsp. europaea]
MASSDDEGEAPPRSVGIYEFVDGEGEPISFAELPIQWKEGEAPDGKQKQIFLRGSFDKGLQKIYKQVVTWKFDLSNEKPEISVLTKENYWIRLLNSRKAYDNIIRTILITVHCLHFVKRNPETSHKSLWDHLGKVFRLLIQTSAPRSISICFILPFPPSHFCATCSLFEPRPSENDLIDHVSLIDEAVKRDATLAKSKLLVRFLEEKPTKRKAFSEDIGTPSKSDFIVDDDMIGENEDDTSDEEDNCFDTVCAICDNGGTLFCCEGKCIRSFHPTVEDGVDSECSSLGYTHAELEAMKKVDFYCKNCEYKQHQCFACGELGSSDESSGAEVFRCVNGACGHFYHPGCVAKLLHTGNETAAAELQRKIATGEQFACPLHKCHVCNELEVKSDPKLQFAVCRRCPKAYHRKCLPSEIAFEDQDENVVQRAWEDLIPNRILIYCLEHDIDEDLCTPVRNHIKFPDSEQKNKKKQLLEAHGKQKVVTKQRSFALEDGAGKKSAAKLSKGVENLSSPVKQGYLSQKRGGKLSGQLSFKKQKVASNNSCVEKPNDSTVTEDRISLGEQLFARFYGTDSDSVKSRQVERVDGEEELSQKAKAKGTSNLLNLDADAKKRILAMMTDASSSVTLKEIVDKYKAPSTHIYSSKYAVDKNVTLGKVEGSVQAVRAALQKMEAGCVTDAKAVCGTDLLHQVMKWKEKLSVYLSPFLYGMRYTSFGRHFTKSDKLKEIVDILHWYVKDGDMVVDFCCGSNDFSCLMKEKLDEIGKSCLYRNYDIVQTKNNFNFEKRDWLEVQPNELPPGSKLIMGLNPPFGVNASLANKFIDKALEFKPKLLVLIVPQETQRLDKKDFPYDLIWENDQMLVGKSFYLPGSVDVNDKQMEDWNVNAPPLYLWSHPGWTPKHKDIAHRHGHLFKDQKKSSLQEHRLEDVSDAPGERNNLGEYPVHQGDDRTLGNRREHREQEARVTTSHKEEFPHDSSLTEGDRNHGHQKNQSEAYSEEFHGKSKRKRKIRQAMSPEDKSTGKHSVSCQPYHNLDGGRLSDYHSSKSPETHSHIDVGMEGDKHSGSSSFSASLSYSQTRHGGNLDDDLVRKYSLHSEEPYPSLTNRRSHTPNPEYGFRTSDPSLGYPRGTTDIHSYRSYEMGEKYGRDVNIHSNVNLPGRRDHPHSWTPNYTPNPGPGYHPTYGQPVPSGNSTYGGMNTSTMQRYAPRLDELNHRSINHVRSGQPLPDTSGVFRPPFPRPGFPTGSLSFFPGPRHPFPDQNSSGWLNE